MVQPGEGWKGKTWWPALRTSSSYALAALLWILLSDTVVGLVIKNPIRVTHFHTLKGTLFVVVTGIILFLDRQAGERASRRDRLEALESEAKFRSLIEHAPVGIVVADDRGLISEANAAMAELTGFPLAELTGRAIWTLTAAENREDVLAEFRRLKALGHIHTELQSRRKDGQVVSLAISAARIRPDLSIGFVRDITDQKLTEERQRAASEERLAMLEAASLARVVPWSMDQTGWMQWGESLGAVFQWPDGPVRRHQGWPWDRIHQEDHLRLRIALAQADQGFISSFECRMTQKGKRWIWTRWTLAEEGGRYHGAVQDIHEQHEIQAQLLQTQKLESMGTLVGGITHDFNNLLMAILGFSELLLQDATLTSVQHRGMDTIYRAASRGRTLIDQFLGFSRKLPTRRVQANLNGLLVEASRLLQHAVSTNVDLRLDLAPDLPDAYFDPGQMHQVVMNLTLNARDAIQDHGTITLRTKLVEVGPELASAHGRPRGTYLLLEVEDDGVGIPPDTIHRIFEPFFTTKGAKGTGLGLSMVHGIVTEHGGILECQSKVGKGTTLRVHLPLMATLETGPKADPGGIPRIGILLLTAQAQVLDRLTGALTTLGQAGANVSTPGQALERIGQGGWDLLVLEPEALAGQDELFLGALEKLAWKGQMVSVGARLAPSFQPRILGHLSRAFTLFDLVEILDRTPLEEAPHAAHPAP